MNGYFVKQTCASLQGRFNLETKKQDTPNSRGGQELRLKVLASEDLVGK